MPVNWAMTQNNLGTTLAEQGTRTGGEAGTALLADAVAAYRAALEVRTRQDMPVEWAMTQENIAIALAGDGGAVGRTRSDGGCWPRRWQRWTGRWKFLTPST